MPEISASFYAKRDPELLATESVFIIVELALGTRERGERERREREREREEREGGSRDFISKGTRYLRLFSCRGPEEDYAELFLL